MTYTTDATPMVPSTADSDWSKRFNAYGALAVTAAIFAAFFYGMAVTAWRNDTQSFGTLMETVKTLLILAAGFWLGSSNSKRQQDEVLAATTIKQNETIAAQGVALATSAPVATSAPIATVTTTKTETGVGETTTVTAPAVVPSPAPVPPPAPAPIQQPIAPLAPAPAAPPPLVFPPTS